MRKFAYFVLIRRSGTSELESVRENFSRPSGTDSIFPAFSQR